MIKVISALSAALLLTGCSQSPSEYLHEKFTDVMFYLTQNFGNGTSADSEVSATDANVFTVGNTYPETDFISNMYINEYANKTGNAVLRDYLVDLQIGHLMSKENLEKEITKVTGQPAVCGFNYNLIMQSKNPDYSNTKVTLVTADEMGEVVSTMSMHPDKRKVIAYFNNRPPIEYLVKCNAEDNSCGIAAGTFTHPIANTFNCINPETNNPVSADGSLAEDPVSLVKSVNEPLTSNPKQWEGYTLIKTQGAALLQEYLNSVEADRYTLHDVELRYDIPFIKRVDQTYYFQVSYDIGDKFYGTKVCDKGIVTWTEGSDKLQLAMDCT